MCRKLGIVVRASNVRKAFRVCLLLFTLRVSSHQCRIPAFGITGALRARRRSLTHSILTMASASPKAAVPTTKRPRARKSIAHMPSPDKMLDQENTDRDPLSLSSHDPPSQRPGSLSRKMRSKSFGPGGLEALKETTGNRRKVIFSAGDAHSNLRFLQVSPASTDHGTVCYCTATQIYPQADGAAFPDQGDTHKTPAWER